jgi:hypothetical protein
MALDSTRAWRLAIGRCVMAEVKMYRVRFRRLRSDPWREVLIPENGDRCLMLDWINFLLEGGDGTGSFYSTPVDVTVWEGEPSNG